jgi:hypothetical protein
MEEKINAKEQTVHWKGGRGRKRLKKHAWRQNRKYWRKKQRTKEMRKETKTKLTDLFFSLQQNHFIIKKTQEVPMIDVPNWWF